MLRDKVNEDSGSGGTDSASVVFNEPTPKLDSHLPTIF